MYEQPPFLANIKEHFFIGILNKSGRTIDEPEDIKVKPQVAIVKDLVTSDIEGSTISFVFFPLTLSQPRTKAQFQVHQLYLSK